MSGALVLGLCLSLAQIAPGRSRLSMVILAPQSDAVAVRELLDCETREALRSSAKERGYRVLGEASPLQLVHEDFLANSQYAMALDVVRCLKGFDPKKAIELDDFPADLKRRIEPLFRRWANRSNDSLPLRFSVEPFPNLGVEDPRVPGRLSPPTIKDFVPGWAWPPMHPLTEGYAPRGSSTTLPNPEHRPNAGPERSYVDRSALVFANPQNDQMRVRWAQDLWKAVGDLVEAQRQEYLAEQQAEGKRVLDSFGLLQGFVDGKAKLSSVTPAMRRFVEQRLEALGVASRPDLGLVLRGCELFIWFEAAPHSYTGTSLGGILGWDGGTPR